MALQDIFKALEHQAERDIDDVLSEARARAAGIVHEAELDAQRIRDTHATDAQTSGAARGVHILNAARLDARRKIAAVRQRAVQQAFDRAREQLLDARSATSYDALFERLLDEALEGVEGEFELLVDERDVGRAEASLSRRGIGGSVRPGLTTAGGVVVSMEGDRVFRRNTIEDRFEKLAGMSQAEVAEILFS